MAVNQQDLLTYLKSSKPTNLAAQWGEARYRPVAEQAQQFVLDPGKFADYAVQNGINSVNGLSFLQNAGLSDQNLSERFTGAKQKKAFSTAYTAGKDISTLPEFQQWLTGAFKGDQNAGGQYYSGLSDNEKKALQRKVLGDYGIQNNLGDSRNANVLNFKPTTVAGSPYDASQNGNIRSSSAVWDLVTKLKDDYFSGYDITKTDLFKNAHPDIQQQALQKLDLYYRNPLEWNNRTKSEGYNSYSSGNYTPLGQRFKTPQEMDAYFQQQGVVNPNPSAGTPNYGPGDIRSGHFENGTWIPNTPSNGSSNSSAGGGNISKDEFLQQYGRSGDPAYGENLWERYTSGQFTPSGLQPYSNQSNTATGPTGNNPTGTGSPDIQKLVDRALLSNSTVNLNSYDWWNAAPQDVREAAYRQLQQITGSAEALADYAFKNGLTDLQNYSWWSTSPYKDQAWQIIQSRQNSGEQPGGANTPGSTATPTNNNAPTIPDVLMSDLFPDTTTSDPTTGNEVLDFDKFMQQIGLKDSNAQVADINTKLQDIQTQITNREKQLADEIGEARDNIWLSASSLDRRVNSAKARAQDDISILLQKQKVYTDQITAINDNIKQSQQAYQTYVDTAVKIENMKRDNAKAALEQAQAKIDAYYKAQDLQLKQKNYDMLYQNNIRDNSRQAISTLVTALGADAFKVIDPQTFANAGFGALDMTAMAAAISKKDQADLLKNTDSPFAAWLDAYNKGDTARMQAVETYLQSQKGNNTSLGDYLLGGTALSLPSVADDNTKLKGVKAEGDLILANCVKYQRYLDPSLPYGLTTLQDKINILLKGPNGSKTPTVGAVGVFDVGTTAGHVAKVVEIKNGMMRLRESNYGGQYARDDRWVPITSALGFWTPSALQSRNDGSFPNIDSKFDEYYAQYKAGTRTKESILSDLTYGITDKGQVKIIRDYVNQKWTQTEQTFSGFSTDQINKFFQSFGINLNLPNIPAQSQPKYPLNEKPASTTSRKLSNSDIIKLKAAGLWKNEYANMNIWELPEDVLFELF